jgi:hypothetical protein
MDQSDNLNIDIEKQTTIGDMNTIISTYQLGKAFAHF